VDAEEVGPAEANCKDEESGDWRVSFAELHILCMLSSPASLQEGSIPLT